MRKKLGYLIASLPFIVFFVWMWVDSDLQTALKVSGITILVVLFIIGCGFISAKLINE